MSYLFKLILFAEFVINIYASPINISSNETIVRSDDCSDTGEGASDGGYSSAEEFCEMVVREESCSCEYPETWPTRSCLKSCKCCGSGKFALSSKDIFLYY